LQLLAIVKQRNKPVSQVCRLFEPVPQIARNVGFKPGRPLEEAAIAREAEKGRATLGQDGRLVVRPSGTEPVIRVMAEADNFDLIERVVTDVCAALSALAQAA
jgi:phosphoglucosamine mutase